MGDNTVKTKTAGNGTAANGSGAITREKLICELGKTGGVLFDLVSERVDQRLNATSQDRASAVTAAASTFSRQVEAVSTRAASLERRLPAMQSSVNEAKTAARDSTSAAQAAERAASGAAENASAAVQAEVNGLKTLLSGDVPELVQNEKGELIVTTVHKEPEGYIDALQSVITQAVSLLTQVDARLRNLEGLSLLTDFDGRLRSLEAMLTGKKPVAEPEKAAAETADDVITMAAEAKVKELEKKLVNALKALGMDVDESAEALPLEESMAQLEGGLAAASEELGMGLNLKAPEGDWPASRLLRIERYVDLVAVEAEKRNAAGKAAGDE